MFHRVKNVLISAYLLWLAGCQACPWLGHGQESRVVCEHSHEGTCTPLASQAGPSGQPECQPMPRAERAEACYPNCPPKPQEVIHRVIIEQKPAPCPPAAAAPCPGPGPAAAPPSPHALPAAPAVQPTTVYAQPQAQFVPAAQPQYMIASPQLVAGPQLQPAQAVALAAAAPAPAALPSWGVRVGLPSFSFGLPTIGLFREAAPVPAPAPQMVVMQQPQVQMIAQPQPQYLAQPQMVAVQQQPMMQQPVMMQQPAYAPAALPAPQRCITEAEQAAREAAIRAEISAADARMGEAILRPKGAMGAGVAK